MYPYDCMHDCFCLDPNAVENQPEKESNEGRSLEDGRSLMYRVGTNRVTGQSHLSNHVAVRIGNHGNARREMRVP